MFNLKHHSTTLFFFICFISISLSSCEINPPHKLHLENAEIIPLPKNITGAHSSFRLTPNTNIFVPKGLTVTNELTRIIEQETQFILDPTITNKPEYKGIQLFIDEDFQIGKEGYQIIIKENKIDIKAPNEHGLFYAIHTLSQVFKLHIHEKDEIEEELWLIPAGTIQDSPEYEYRGAMLDVSRHFFSVSDVKRYIDLISQYKINHLHLHLSDDQGWRIEIKSWPKLTTIGSRTEVDGGEGGFYTQEEYKDIVAYAQKKFVTIVPEIDMPGHTNAALASYPELNCNGKSPDLYTGIDVGFSTLCTSKEIVYTFVDDVVRELSEITPGPYIHIGGDESHVTELKDYIPFIERVSGIVEKYDKKVIGWDEIANAKLPNQSVVQYWNEAENAKMGIAQGANVLMSPAHKTYLDMQYDSTSRIGLHWAAYIEVDSAYQWDPTTLTNEIKKENILGIESPLWSETVLNMNDIEYLAFPRIICHAEIGWTPLDLRNWENFQQRLASHENRLNRQRVDFYHSTKIPWNQ